MKSIRITVNKPTLSEPIEFFIIEFLLNDKVLKTITDTDLNNITFAMNHWFFPS